MEVIFMLKAEELKLVSEWDKTFPKSEKVDHEKVTFVNRYGITLAADLYKPKNAFGKYPAIAVSGPFGAVKEQCSGLYAQTMAADGSKVAILVKDEVDTAFQTPAAPKFGSSGSEVSSTEFVCCFASPNSFLDSEAPCSIPLLCLFPNLALMLPFFSISVKRKTQDSVKIHPPERRLRRVL